MTRKYPDSLRQSRQDAPADEAKADDLRRKQHDKTKPADQPADDSIEGEGSPGLSITGGGGHA